MREIYCLPLTAATDKLHLGNLYSWILADSYKKASHLLGIDVELRESWNCFSKRLEDEVSSEFPQISDQQINEKCRQIIDENISRAQIIFSDYDVSFSLPAIRDDSKEYREIVMESYRRGEQDGRIKNFFLQIPKLDEILEMAMKITFHPAGSVNSIKGISTLKEIQLVPLLRNGNYGIKIDGIEDMVFGQRYVQSLLPEFYRQHLRTPDIAIFGKDVVAKWIYFMIANSTSRPFSNLGLHGLILKKGGGKISKYDVDIPIIEDITSHPDNVRLSLLKQKFGIDFYFPDFEEEEKFRRKIENCLNFYMNYKPTDRDNENIDLESKIKELEKNILNKIRRLNFSGAYQDFKSLTYEQISSIIIPSIRSRGISQKSLRQIFLSFMEIANVFTPSTVKKFLERSRKAS